MLLNELLIYQLCFLLFVFGFIELFSTFLSFFVEIAKLFCDVKYSAVLSQLHIPQMDHWGLLGPFIEIWIFRGMLEKYKLDLSISDTGSMVLNWKCFPCLKYFTPNILAVLVHLWNSYYNNKPFLCHLIVFFIFILFAVFSLFLLF